MNRSPFLISILVVISVLVVACSSNAGAGDNPSQGMQVATISATSQKGTIDFATPVTAPTSDLGPLILMQDDFSNPNSGWEVYSGDYGYTGYEQGGYVVHATVEKEYNWGVAGVDFDNVRIDVDVTVLQAPANLEDGFGVDCRIQENGDGYGFRISSDGYAEIIVFSNGENNALYEWTINPAINTDGKLNHLTAVCEGNHFSFYINESLITEVVDDTFASGDLAFSAVSFSSDPVKVLFDDIIVQSIGNAYEYADATSYPVNIINNSKYNICGLYISSAESDFWGDSWIGDTDPIAPGTTITIDGNVNQVVDVQAMTCDFLRLYEEYDLDSSKTNTVVINEPITKKYYDFTSLDGWSDSEIVGGKAAINQGEYYSIKVQSGSNFSSGLVNFPVQDITLRTDASLAKAGDANQAAYGLMCRVQPDGSGIFFAVRSDGFGSIQKWDGRTLTLLTDWVAADSINQGINANYIEGTCKDDTYSLFVNGVYVTEVQNTDFLIGKVGVGVVPSSGSETQVDFDFVELLQPLN
jgi:hypothetical protein